MKNPIVGKLKAQSTRTVEIEYEDLGKFDWIIRPLSTLEMVDNTDIFEDMPAQPQVDPKTIDKTGPASSKTVKAVLPMMKKILPMCSISPRITLDDNDPKLNDAEGDTIHLNQIPIRLAFEVFNKILYISGLTKEAEDERKKLQSPPLASS